MKTMYEVTAVNGGIRISDSNTSIFIPKEHIFALIESISRFVRPPPLSPTPYSDKSSRRVRVEPEFQASQLLGQLSKALDKAPVESGFTHEGEALLADAFELHAAEASRALLPWCRELEEVEQAQALLLLARTQHPAAAKLVRELAGDALSNSDLEVREAGIHALEAIGGSEAVALLRGHSEPDPVLAEYMECVVRDLTG